MKILLVRLKPHPETIGLQHVMICEPLELEYLAANHGSDADVEIIDLILERHPLEHFIGKHQPDMVVFSGYITLVNEMKQAADRVKASCPQTTVVVGGVHAEVNPQDFVHEAIDYIICANGIETFQKLIQKLESQEKDAVESIEGLYKNGRNPKIHRHFNHQHPDRKSVSKYRRYYYYMFHNPCALIKTSFGCPFGCAFCFCREVTQNQYFQRPIEDVLDELEGIVEEEVYIVDDTFLFDEERLMAFINGLNKRGIRKQFLVYGRADFIAGHPELIGRLAEVGLRAVIVGLESHRDDALDAYHKNSSKALNEEAVHILKDHGIEVYGTLIIPMDFKKSDFKALENWLNGMDLTFVNLQPLTPLKGTDIYDTYKPFFILDETDYPKWDLAHVVLQPQHMSIRCFYFQILKTYYKVVMPPRKTWRLIKKYGLKANLKLFWGSSKVSMQYLKKCVKGV